MCIYIAVAPSVAVVVRDPFLMTIAIGQAAGDDPKTIALLGYDTSFNAAKGFYHSALVAQFPCFLEKPFFVIAMFLHSNKRRETHQFFWSTLTNEFPGLKKAKKICTDSEDFGLAETMPTTKIFNCMRHFRCNIRDILRKHPTWNKQIVDDIMGTLQLKGLVDCTSLGEYEKYLHAMEQKWPSEFVTYFRRHKDPIIRGKAHFNICSRIFSSINNVISVYADNMLTCHREEYFGEGSTRVYSNGSESINAQQKLLLEFKEVSPAKFMDCLHTLIQSEVLDIITSFQGLGPMRLASGFENLRLPLDALRPSSNTSRSSIRTLAIKHVTKFFPELRDIPGHQLRQISKHNNYSIDNCKETTEAIMTFRATLQLNDIDDLLLLDYLKTYDGNINRAVSQKLYMLTKCQVFMCQILINFHVGGRFPRSKCNTIRARRKRLATAWGCRYVNRGNTNTHSNSDIRTYSCLSIQYTRNVCCNTITLDINQLAIVVLEYS